MADFSKKFLEHLELFYQELNIEPFSDKYFRTYLTSRVWNDFNKFAICLFDDNFNTNKIDLNIKVLEKDDNNYYVYPVQTIDFNCLSFSKTFSVSADRLVWEDKQILLKLLSDGINITIAKGSENSYSYESDTGSKNSEPELTIKMSTISEVLFKRLYIGDEYKIPVTLSLCSLNFQPIGIKVSKYNVHRQESEGLMFLVIHPFVWRKDGESYLNKKKNKSEKMEIRESYYITELLEKYLWRNLINNIQFMLEKA